MLIRPVGCKLEIRQLHPVAYHEETVAEQGLVHFDVWINRPFLPTAKDLVLLSPCHMYCRSVIDRSVNLAMSASSAVTLCYIQ
jgi:hypothetical protein